MNNECKSATDKDLRKIKLVQNKKKKTSKKLCSAVLKKLNKLNSLLKQQDSKCWQIGDMCIELMDNYYLSLKMIAEFTHYSKARISHFHLTARTFDKKHRKGYTFEDSLTARQIWLRLPRLEMTPIQIRKIVSKLKNKRPRQVRAYFIQQLIEKEKNQSIASSSKVSFNSGCLINNCYHSDYRDIIPKLPIGSVKVFLCDPPFGTYKKLEDGHYMSSKSETSGMRDDCDNGSTEEALSVTLPLFEICLPKLATDGVLLLFQPGGKADRPEILLQADKYGWKCDYALTWLKGNIKSGNSIYPYRVCSEKILIFSRKTDKVHKQENTLAFSDVLDFQTETQSATIKMDYGKMKMGDYHIFQKPAKLMEFLIQQHSYASDLIVEPFGCSGAGVISSARLNRNWVYIESNEENYIWASQRIKETVSELSTQAG